MEWESLQEITFKRTPKNTWNLTRKRENTGETIANCYDIEEAFAYVRNCYNHKGEPLVPIEDNSIDDLEEPTQIPNDCRFYVWFRWVNNRWTPIRHTTIKQEWEGRLSEYDYIGEFLLSNRENKDD